MYDLRIAAVHFKPAPQRPMLVKNALAAPSINGLTDQKAICRLAAAGQRKRIAGLGAAKPCYVTHRTEQLE